MNDSKATPLEALPRQDDEPNVQMEMQQEQQEEMAQPPQPQQMQVQYQPPPMYIPPPPQQYQQSRKVITKLKNNSYFDKLKNIIFSDWKKLLVLTLVFFVVQSETLTCFLRTLVRMAKVSDNMVFISSKLLGSVLGALIYLLLQ